MSERPGKRPFSDSDASLNTIIERKINDSETAEYKLVEDRLFHSANLVEVNTEPPVLIRSSFAQMSRELITMSHICITENRKSNKYGDKFILLLDNDGIPHNTWVIFSMLISNNAIFDTTYFNDTTVDDILYLTIKFNISMIDTDRSLYIGRINCTHLITSICKDKIMQRFPRLERMQKDIPQINALVDWYHSYLPMISNVALRTDTFNQLSYVPYLYNLIAIKLSMHYMTQPPAESPPPASIPPVGSFGGGFVYSTDAFGIPPKSRRSKK